MVHPLISSATLEAAIEAGALDVGVAARRLGIDPSRVRHRLAHRRLFGIHRRGRWVLPAWQFGPDGRPVPGLAEVLPTLPAGMHPVSIWGFFTTVSPDLSDGERQMTPMQWLAGGGGPAAVADMARDLALLP